jgi:hypothetical protein
MAVHLLYVCNHRAIVLATMTPTAINKERIVPGKSFKTMEKENSGV